MNARRILPVVLLASALTGCNQPGDRAARVMPHLDGAAALLGGQDINDVRGAGVDVAYDVGATVDCIDSCSSASVRVAAQAARGPLSRGVVAARADAGSAEFGHRFPKLENNPSNCARLLMAEVKVGGNAGCTGNAWVNGRTFGFDIVPSDDGGYEVKIGQTTAAERQ